ncbi:bile acid:sodium symporter family protein [Gaoshiqia sp. Z1-71]|uniref:bile acid:sodium symporter family protein n=1 Tax=Gaoshiqia hydrogeniformans TaxID=3290090 RepID=UPI003BF7FED7
MAVISLKSVRKYLPDGFISSMILMIFLAWLIPGIGKAGSAIELKALIRYGNSLLFFFYGLRLSPEKLKNDLSNWRLHVLIQLITFLVFPLVVLLFRPLLKGAEGEILWLSVFFLAVLPSTVSSSVVMVSIAKGNIPSAIFNASISGVIGILITPAWMGLFLEKQNEAFAFAGVLKDLALQILIPLCLGLFLHRFWGGWARRYNSYISKFDRSVILLIVYHSFSNAFMSDIFSSIRMSDLLGLSASVILLFFLIFEGTKLLTRLLPFKREDRITVLFCGSKKSLVHGSVMASVLFAGSGLGSLFLVPVMIYHAFQLFYISIVARRYGNELRPLSE